MLDIFSILSMPNMSVMLFVFLCFLGLFVMFLCLLREQSNMLKTVRHELAENKASLQAVERHLWELTHTIENESAQSNSLGIDSPPSNTTNTEMAKESRAEQDDIGTNFVQAVFVRNEIPEYDNPQAQELQEVQEETLDDDDDDFGSTLRPGSSLSFEPYTEVKNKSLSSDVPLHVISNQNTTKENNEENHAEEPYLLGRPLQPQSLQLEQDMDMNSSSPSLDLYMPPPKR